MKDLCIGCRQPIKENRNGRLYCINPECERYGLVTVIFTRESVGLEDITKENK